MDTLHYHKFNTKTGKAELVIKEFPIGTFTSRASKFIRKRVMTSNFTKPTKRSKLGKLARMYNFLKDKIKSW